MKLDQISFSRCTCQISVITMKYWREANIVRTGLLYFMLLEAHIPRSGNLFGWSADNVVLPVVLWQHKLHMAKEEDHMCVHVFPQEREICEYGHPSCYDYLFLKQKFWRNIHFSSPGPWLLRIQMWVTNTHTHQSFSLWAKGSSVDFLLQGNFLHIDISSFSTLSKINHTHQINWKKKSHFYPVV